MKLIAKERQALDEVGEFHRSLNSPAENVYPFGTMSGLRVSVLKPLTSEYKLIAYRNGPGERN